MGENDGSFKTGTQGSWDMVDRVLEKNGPDRYNTPELELETEIGKMPPGGGHNTPSHDIVENEFLSMGLFNDRERGFVGGFIWRPITSKIFNQARDRASDVIRSRGGKPDDYLRRTNQTQEKDDTRWLVGFCAEIVLSEFLGVEVVNQPNHDYVWNGKRVDVKSNRVKGVPRSNYLFQINARQNWQECDEYHFTMVSYSLDRVFLIGHMAKQDFLNRATLRNPGETGDRGHVFKRETYTIPLDKIMRFSWGDAKDGIGSSLQVRSNVRPGHNFISPEK